MPRCMSAGVGKTGADLTWLCTALQGFGPAAFGAVLESFVILLKY